MKKKLAMLMCVAIISSLGLTACSKPEKLTPTTPTENSNTAVEPITEDTDKTVGESSNLAKEKEVVERERTEQEEAFLDDFEDAINERDTSTVSAMYKDHPTLKDDFDLMLIDFLEWMVVVYDYEDTTKDQLDSAFAWAMSIPEYPDKTIKLETMLDNLKKADEIIVKAEELEKTDPEGAVKLYAMIPKYSKHYDTAVQKFYTLVDLSEMEIDNSAVEGD